MSKYYRSFVIAKNHKIWYHFFKTREKRHNMLTKILIADANEEFRLALTEELCKEHTVRSCASGCEALELLRAYRPDFLVIDMMVFGTDSLTVLQTAKQEGICPPFLACATYFTPYALRMLEQLDVAYMIRKPCELSALVCRIDDLVKEVSQPLFIAPSDYCVVTAISLELGLPARRKGFRCSREAILMLIDNPSLQVTKEIYPALAKMFDSQVKAVEKNIRDLIYDAWTGRDEAAWRKYFPVAPNGQVARPSNGVFLSLLAEQVGQLRRMAQ